MKNLILLILFLSFYFGNSQVKLVSWNIRDMGKSKNTKEISYIADQLKKFDVVAIQEVVSGNGGAQSVARLAHELNRTGNKWDYSISDPTKSSPYISERYAYLWKSSKIDIVGKAKLDKYYDEQIEREPYIINFKYNDLSFTLLSYHALPKSKEPEKEIKFFENYSNIYSKYELFFLGDFNLPSNHLVFDILKDADFTTIMKGQKTSLKLSCVNSCLSQPYDHIFFNKKSIKILDSGVIHFYKDFEDIKAARKISDHIPIWVEFDTK